MRHRRFGILISVMALAMVPCIDLVSAQNAVTPSNSGVFDPRSFGVTGNGTADDTAALQATIKAACAFGAAHGAVVPIPPNFIIKISAPISFQGCSGLRFGGIAYMGGNTQHPAIVWGGPRGGILLSADGMADSIIEHIALDLGTADIAIDDTETGSHSPTNTQNTFDDIVINGPAGANPNFVGIRVGYNDTVGNVDLGTFRRLFIQCSTNTLPRTSTSNGDGILFAAGSAEPYQTTSTNINFGNCSRGYDIEGAVATLIMDGSGSGFDYTDLYVANQASGFNIVFRDFQSSNAANPIVQNADGGIHDLMIDHVNFNAPSPGTLISLAGGTSQQTINAVTFGGAKGVTPIAGGGNLTILNSHFGGVCPDIAKSYRGYYLWMRNNVSDHGGPCQDAILQGISNGSNPILFGAIAHSGETANQNSPALELCGFYISGAANSISPDCWKEQAVIGGDGTSTLRFSHAGSGGTSSVQFPELSLANALMSSATPTIGSGFSSGASKIVANGTAAFSVTIGSGPGHAGTINFPAAAHGWICQAQDATTHSPAVSQTIQTASTRTSCTLTQFSAAMAPSSWLTNDVLLVHAYAY